MKFLLHRPRTWWPCLVYVGSWTVVIASGVIARGGRW